MPLGLAKTPLASMPLVTFPEPIAVVIAVDPEPDTSPERVIVWFEVRHVAQPMAPVDALYVTGLVPDSAEVEAYALAHWVVEATSGMT